MVTKDGGIGGDTNQVLNSVFPGIKSLFVYLSTFPNIYRYEVSVYLDPDFIGHHQTEKLGLKWERTGETRGKEVEDTGETRTSQLGASGHIVNFLSSQDDYLICRERQKIREGPDSRETGVD